MEEPEGARAPEVTCTTHLMDACDVYAYSRSWCEVSKCVSTTKDVNDMSELGPHVNAARGTRTGYGMFSQTLLEYTVSMNEN